MKKDIKNFKSLYDIKTGKITYQDLNRPEKILFSKKYRLSGKPDFIIKKAKLYVPVEIKSGYHLKPEKYHVMQLAAYCHLIEENYNKFVPRGNLIYCDTGLRYSIDFNPKMRFDLKTTIENMRNTLKKGIVGRNHRDSRKCKRCSYQNYCDQKII